MSSYFNLQPGCRYVMSRDGEPVLQKSRSNRGFVIEGVASKYDTILFHDRLKYICIAPGAFDVSLKHDPVQLWLDHDSKLAMPGCRVELFSNEEALHFRAHLDDSELAFHARDLVACGSHTQCSLGWHSSKHVTRDIDGTPVTFILQGDLTHIALVPAGAIKTTHAKVSRLADCGTIEHDCKSFRFASDNAATELQRALRRLDT